MPDTWYGAAAHTLRRGALSVVVLPDHGGKLASLRHGPREWLAAPAGPLPPPRYGAAFTAADMSGWDEMLPTVDACVLGGTALPDHGEVWALPWRVESAGAERIVTSVAGRALPYACTRTLALTGPHTLRLDYAVEATGDSPVPVLWAAHPQCTVRPGTQIVLPAAVSEVVEIYPGAGRVPWAGGEAMRGLAEGEARKVYLPPERPVGWAGLADPGGAWLRLSWDPRKVPYLGIWFDAMFASREPVVALEPTTGYYDALDRAVRAGRVSLVRPGRTFTFGLTVEAGDSPADAPWQRP